MNKCEDCECQSACGGDRNFVLRSIRTGTELEPEKVRSLTCYLAGGMQGILRYNEESFTKGAASLRAYGITVISPFEIDLEKGYLVEAGDGTLVQCSDFDYEAVLADDFKIIENVDFVALLPGWQNSLGAKREVEHASSIGVPSYEILYNS